MAIPVNEENMASVIDDVVDAVAFTYFVVCLSLLPTYFVVCLSLLPTYFFVCLSLLPTYFFVCLSLLPACFQDSSEHLSPKPLRRLSNFLLVFFFMLLSGEMKLPRYLK